MVRTVFLVVIVIMVSFAGCRTTRPSNLANRSLSCSEVQEITRRHHAFIQTMSGEGRISIETPEIAQSGTFLLTLQKPDSILIHLQGPFGLKVGSALVTRTEFFFYNSLENKLITGESNAENLNRILHLQLSFDDLINLFGGGTFLESDRHLPSETRWEDDEVVYVFASSKTSRRYWIDPATMLIQKIQFLDQRGKTVLEQAFSDFEEVKGFSMPYTIRVSQPNVRQRLTLNYSDIQVNAEKLYFTFTIPPNAERIHW